MSPPGGGTTVTDEGPFDLTLVKPATPGTVPTELTGHYDGAGGMVNDLDMTFNPTESLQGGQLLPGQTRVAPVIWTAGSPMLPTPPPPPRRLCRRYPPLRFVTPGQFNLWTGVWDH